jgi:hypothetical protein
MKYCKKCDSQKPLTKEYWHKRKSSKDGWEFYCKSCVHKTTKANYWANREKWNATTRKNKQLQRDRINEYKNNCSCKKCGESRNHLLDFHHIDPSTKSFQISQGEGYGWKKVKNEIKKCIVLCSNCHRDFHFLQKTTRISINKYVHS